MNPIHPTENKERANARIAGWFYLVAAVASIFALSFYQPILFDPGYLLEGAKNANQILFGAFLELLSVVAVAGTAIMLSPTLKKFNESLTLAYFSFRFIEAILILIGALSVLSLLTLSQAYTNAPSPDIATFQTNGSVLKAVHDWTFILGPNFMLGINTFLYSYIFYRTQLIPTKISILGLAGAITIFLASLLEMFGIFPQVSLWGVLFALPVFVYEMTLAIWLIAKGFNPTYLSK
ncbi:MAG: hypothetical protein JWP69_1723 [Flaviaesturariibacter sp.]|nr:hypothetical protein [Flaviaesturariibacter sp.]